MKALFVVCLLICLNFFKSVAQYRFSHIDITDGLVENSVTDIFQDSEGYIWIATQDGLSQYDGYRFNNYTFSNNKNTSLSDNFLWSIIEDEKGFIWCCSRNGINKIDKLRGKCQRFFRAMDKGVSFNNQSYSIANFENFIYVSFYDCIYKFPDTLATQSQDLVLDKSFQVDYNKSFNNVLLFIPDTIKNKLYAITHKGIFDVDSMNFVPFNDNITDREFFFYSYSFDSAGNIWFSNTHDLYFMNRGVSSLKQIDLDLGQNIKISKIELFNGNIWIATNNGIYIYDKRKIIGHISTKNTPGFSSDNPEALLCDVIGNMWIGSSARGIDIYKPELEQFKFIDKHLLGEEYIIQGISEVKEGDILVSTNSRLLLLKLLPGEKITSNTFAYEAFHKAKRIFIPEIKNFNPGFVSLASNSDILLGNNGKSLIILDENYKYRKQIQFNKGNRFSNHISDVAFAGNGKIWVSTFKGLFLLDSNYNEVDWKQQFNDSVFNSPYVLDLYIDTDSTLWIGSNKGFYSLFYNERKIKYYPYNKNDLLHSAGFNFISGFHDFGDGYLWVASFGGGIGKMNKKTGLFTHFTTSEGLSNNICNSLIADSNKNLWISTNKGINCLHTLTNEIEYYTQEDGVHFNEFNLHVGYLSKHNEILFGTPKSVVVFQPKDIKKSDYQPKTILTDLKINYQPALQRINHNRLDIFPNDKSISFTLAGLNYSNSPKIKYRYMLKGFDDDWIMLNNINPSSNYTHLPSGKYNYIAACTNKDGIWSNHHLKIKLVVHPPFYKTWWFFTIFNIVGISIFILIIRYFAQRKIKRQMRELLFQQKFQSEKERISRDLHDNIGSQITYLISTIDQKAYTDAQNQTFFNQLGDNVRNIMNLLRQTIWVIKKDEIRLEEFEQKITDYVHKIFEGLNIESHILTEGNKDINISPTITMHLYRIVQEALNNIQKHAKASAIEIRFVGFDDKLVLNIKDNGIGINNRYEKQGHYGLKNMENRTKELNGNFLINRLQEGGTFISLTIPLREN